jgi:hypothetical protein
LMQCVSGVLLVQPCHYNIACTQHLLVRPADPWTRACLSVCMTCVGVCVALVAVLSVTVRYTQLVVVATDATGFFSTGSKHLCMALLLGVPIVREQWVTDSCCAGHMLPYQEYITKVGWFGGCYTAAPGCRGAVSRGDYHHQALKAVLQGFWLLCCDVARLSPSQLVPVSWVCHHTAHLTWHELPSCQETSPLQQTCVISHRCKQ